MGTELSILALYGLVVIALIVLQVLAALGQLGLGGLASARDDIPPLSGMAARLDRALQNSIVAMTLFAPAVLILAVSGTTTATTLLAAQVFLVARILYVVAYASGIPFLRTAIWSAGFAATVVLYLACFAAVPTPA